MFPRIFFLHFTVLFCFAIAIVFGSMGVLIIFILTKTIVDAVFHTNSHYNFIHIKEKSS